MCCLISSLLRDLYTGSSLAAKLARLDEWLLDYCSSARHKAAALSKAYRGKAASAAGAPEVGQRRLVVIAASNAAHKTTTTTTAVGSVEAPKAERLADQKLFTTPVTSPNSGSKQLTAQNLTNLVERKGSPELTNEMTSKKGLLKFVKYTLIFSNAFGFILAIFLGLFGIAYPDKHFPLSYKGREMALCSLFCMLFTTIGYCGAQNHRRILLIIYGTTNVIIVIIVIILWFLFRENSILGNKEISNMFKTTLAITIAVMFLFSFILAFHIQIFKDANQDSIVSQSHLLLQQTTAFLQQQQQQQQQHQQHNHNQLQYHQHHPHQSHGYQQHQGQPHHHTQLHKQASHGQHGHHHGHSHLAGYQTQTQQQHSHYRQPESALALSAAAAPNQSLYGDSATQHNRHQQQLVALLPPQQPPPPPPPPIIQTGGSQSLAMPQIKHHRQAQTSVAGTQQQSNPPVAVSASAQPHLLTSQVPLTSQYVMRNQSSPLPGQSVPTQSVPAQGQPYKMHHQEQALMPPPPQMPMLKQQHSRHLIPENQDGHRQQQQSGIATVGGPRNLASYPAQYCSFQCDSTV